MTTPDERAARLDELDEPACTCGGPASTTTLPSGVTYEEHRRDCAVMADDTAEPEVVARDLTAALRERRPGEPAPCRTTQHCAYHGWCRRCAPGFAATMSRINVAIQRTDPDESHWGPLYEAIGKALNNGEECPRTTADNPPTSSDTPDNPHEERIRALIEDEMYEYRERAMWWPEGEIAKEIARLATRGAMEALTGGQASAHIYLSTGCLHGDHAYCQSMTGLNGAKRPASCKKCGAACICPCHTTKEP